MKTSTPHMHLMGSWGFFPRNRNNLFRRLRMPVHRTLKFYFLGMMCGKKKWCPITGFMFWPLGVPCPIVGTRPFLGGGSVSRCSKGSLPTAAHDELAVGVASDEAGGSLEQGLRVGPPPLLLRGGRRPAPPPCSKFQKKKSSLHSSSPIFSVR